MKLFSRYKSKGRICQEHSAKRLEGTGLILIAEFHYVIKKNGNVLEFVLVNVKQLHYSFS